MIRLLERVFLYTGAITRADFDEIECAMCGYTQRRRPTSECGGGSIPTLVMVRCRGEAQRRRIAWAAKKDRSHRTIERYCPFCVCGMIEAWGNARDVRPPEHDVYYVPRVNKYPEDSTYWTQFKEQHDL